MRHLLALSCAVALLTLDVPSPRPASAVQVFSRRTRAVNGRVRAMRALPLAFLLTLAGTASLAHAVDQPIAATKLLLKRSPSGKQTLTFVSKDPAFLFPTIGSADDPATGTPGGATIELFS